MERYSLRIKKPAAKELEAVSRKGDRQRLTARIRALAITPRPPGCEKLAGLEGRYRIRQGDYRVVYSVDDDEREVLVVKISHRREIYR